MESKLTSYDMFVLKLIQVQKLNQFIKDNQADINKRKRLSKSLQNLKDNSKIILQNCSYYELDSNKNIKHPINSANEVCEVFEPIVYVNSKFNHNGLTSYKVFENCYRNMSKNSLSNLLNKSLDLTQFRPGEITLKQNRSMSEAMSRKCRNYCSKLVYYSRNRTFVSKKSGQYNMKVAFLTLTTPSGTNTTQSLKAFNLFLDYLRRTANCVYIWKKELGEQSKQLHYHILVNNFIPYYIINWKWKKLLIAQGVIWPKNNKGEETTSHYRIELPRKAQKISYYISKYIAKDSELPMSMGYIWGKSEILDKCKEIEVIESDLPLNEITSLKEKYKTILNDWVQHICCNPKQIKHIAPKLFEVFKEQWLEFNKILTLPQKFYYV